MGKYNAIAKIIIENIGGKKNIISIYHCTTRLRFRLKDESKCNTNILNKTDGIITVLQAAGQYQLVIGNHVPDVYAEVLKVAHIKSEENESVEDDKNLSMGAKLIDMISGIFSPTLGVLSAAGILKGLLALWVFIGMQSGTDVTASGAYGIWNSVADGFFYYLPVILGYTAAKKFKVNEFIGMAMGISLVYPAMIGLESTELLGSVFTGTSFQMNYFSTFFGIPVIMPMSGYAQSVIPVILSVWVAAKLYKFCYSKFNDNVKVFMAPFVVLLVMVPATYIVIGPIATMLSNLVGLLFTMLYGIPVVGGVISGVLIGGFWQIFVIFGIHWGLIPIMMMNFGTLGYDFVLAPYFACSFAQTMVVLAIILKTKDSHLKKIALPAFISGIFGVTEPAIYGITLPKKKPFVISCIAGAIGGGIIGAAGVKIYSMAGMGFFALSGFIDPNVGGTGLYSLIWTIIAILIAMVVGFVVTYATYKDDEIIINDKDKEIKNNINVKSGINKIEICSPLKGKVTPLDSVSNASFANGTLGLGVAIIPEIGQLYSPCDGYVTTLFPTGHAIGITSEDNTKVLIHIGIDTVRLEGKFFKPLVKQGDKVKKNQKILEFNIEEIINAGYSLETPVVIINSNEYLDVLETTSDYIDYNEVLLTILK